MVPEGSVKCNRNKIVQNVKIRIIYFFKPLSLVIEKNIKKLIENVISESL